MIEGTEERRKEKAVKGKVKDQDRSKKRGSKEVER